jgi:hypothetical protein
MKQDHCQNTMVGFIIDKNINKGSKEYAKHKNPKQCTAQSQSILVCSLNKK